jgi:hypothetical protein
MKKVLIGIAAAALLVAGVAMAGAGNAVPVEVVGLTLSPDLIGPGLVGLAMAGMINTKAGEKLAVVGTIDPQTVANTELFTDVVDMRLFHQALGIALLGNMAAETIDFAAYTCDSDGNNAAELKDTTQLAAHASNNDNKQLVISVRTEELIASGKTHIKFGLVTGNTTGGPAAVVALGVDARSLDAAGPADLASVAEIQL